MSNPIRNRLLVATFCVVITSGCTKWRTECAGYGCKTAPCIVDPRGAVREPCLNCEPVPPTCCDTDACCQLRDARETFFDSLYALLCECNCWSDDCCD